MAFLSQSWFADFALIILTLFTLLYLYFKYCYTYWKRRGVRFMEPSFPCGNFEDAFCFRKPMGAVFVDIYNYFDGHKFGGFYQLHKPTLLLRDLDLIRSVLVKDFAYFQDRGMYHDEERDPLMNNLFVMGGPKWKALRHKLTPTFTSGKMKMMFQTLLACGTELNACVKSDAAKGNIIEVQDILARFTTDVIASCAFGIQCNCLQNPEAEFRLKGRSFLKRSLLGQIGIFLMFFTPSIAKLTKLGITPRAITDFFTKAVKETVEYREKNNATRNDFMQLLIQLKNKGCVDGDSLNNDSASSHKMNMTDVVGQAFIFFVAGFETSSATMSFTLYELAVNPDIQDQLRQEIDDVLAKHDGLITYDAMMEMEYLDRVIAETLRKYPPLTALNRECNTAYTLPGTDVTVEPGVMVIVPLYAIHHDPRYYPEPQRFDPERFTKEEKAKRNPYTYLPFGEGPRNCIGMRFGLMQAKVGLITLLRSYEFQVTEKTSVPLVLDPTLITMGSLGGIPLQITERR